MEKPIGFILLNEYPGSKPAGFFEPYTTGEFVKYPNFWWPVPPFLEFFGQKIAGESIIEMARAVIIEYKKPSFFSMLNNGFSKGLSNVVKGFRLVKEYPGSPQIGSFEPYTTGEYLKFPKYWKVEYKDAATKSDGPIGPTVDSAGAMTQQEKNWQSGIEADLERPINRVALNQYIVGYITWKKDSKFDFMGEIFQLIEEAKKATILNLLDAEKVKISKKTALLDTTLEAFLLNLGVGDLNNAWENTNYVRMHDVQKFGRIYRGGPDAREEKSQSPVEKTTMQKIEEIRAGGQSPEILNEVSLVIQHDKIVLKSLDKSVFLEKELKGFTAQPWSVLISWVGHLRQGLKPEEAFHLAVDKVMTASSEKTKDEEKKLAQYKQHNLTELKEIIAIARCILEEANSVSSRPFRMNRLKGQCDRIEFLATALGDKKALVEEPVVSTYTITRTKDADGKTYLKRVCDGFNPLELLGLLELTQLDIQKQMKGEVEPDVIERQFIKQ